MLAGIVYDGESLMTLPVSFTAQSRQMMESFFAYSNLILSANMKKTFIFGV
jgi:hypothetical protein